MKKVRMQIWVPESLAKEIRREAAEHVRTISSVVILRCQRKHSPRKTR